MGKEKKGRSYFKNCGKSKFACKRKDPVVRTRLRLRDCGLRSGLSLIGKHLDGECECGDSETVRHILIQCNKCSLKCRKLLRDLVAASAHLTQLD